MSNFPSPDSLAQMVNSVTTTMMDVKFVLAPRTQLVEAFRRAVLPIPGKIPVSVVVSGDQASCQKLGARLFQMKPEAIDISLMEDTLRELANITAGQVKRAMSIDAALGLPRIVLGSEPWGAIVESAGEQQIVLRADCDDIHLEVQVAHDPS